MEERGESVAVLVKCPAILNPQTEDFSLELPLVATVADLKASLFTRHPCHPAVQDQRLIFRGHLLNEETSLSAMCEAEASTQLVVHMVLRSGRYPPASTSSSSNGSTEVKAEGAKEKDTRAETEEERERDAEEEMATAKVNISVGETSVPIGPTTPASSTENNNNNTNSPATTHHSSPPPYTTLNQNRPLYYSYIDSDGRSVCTDISNALLFDGRQFYVVRGVNFQQQQMHLTGGLLPFIWSIPSLPSATIPPATQAPIQATPPVHMAAEGNGGARVWRIRFDLSQIFIFAFRFGLVLLLFAQGASSLRLIFISIIFLLLFLIQAGIIPLNLNTDLANRIWNHVLQFRQANVPIPPAADQDNEVDEEDGNADDESENGDEGEDQNDRRNLHNDQNPHDRPLHPRHDRQRARMLAPPRPGPLAKLAQIISTFFLALLPAQPPQQLGR